MTIIPGSSQRPRRQRPSIGVAAGLVTLVVVLAGGTTYWLLRGDGNGQVAAAVVSPTATATGKPTGTTASTRVPTAAAPRPVTADSAHAMLTKALAAATAAQWVHLEIRDSAKGHTASFSDDSGPTGGIQNLAVDGARSTVRLVDGDVYFTADKAALLHYYGFTEVQAARFVDQWLQLSPGGRAYDSVSAGITMASSLKEMSMTGPLRLLPAVTRNGRLEFGIVGKPVGTHVSAHATATMWVAADKSMLPVEFLAVDGQTRMQVTMSRWGHVVDVAQPDSAIPLYPKTTV